MSCTLCPRECKAERTDESRGFCGAGSLPRVAKAMLHQWEEPCISGEKGTGAVFFSGCVLKCCYCQNYNISAENFGKELTVRELADVFLRLADAGASSLDLISGAQYLPQIIDALDLVKPQIKLPVIWNSGGYEKVEALKRLEGYVDVYLPDLKYADSARAARYSAAPDYFPVAGAAIKEMVRQVGEVVIEDGLIKKGVIIRHLVLPGGKKDSMAVLDFIANELPKGVWVSLMSQYTPFYKAKEMKELNRRITTLEYDRVAEHMESLGLVYGYMQEKSSAKEEYTPVFDLSGL